MKSPAPGIPQDKLINVPQRNLFDPVHKLRNRHPQQSLTPSLIIGEHRWCQQELSVCASTTNKSNQSYRARPLMNREYTAHPMARIILRYRYYLRHGELLVTT